MEAHASHSMLSRHRDTGGALQSEIQSESLSLSLTQATNTINKKCGHNEFPITVKLRHNSEDVFVNSMV